MTRLARLIVVLTGVLAAPAFAHPGHSHAIKQPAAETKAKAVVQTMIQRKILDASWAGRAPARAERRDGGGGEVEWLVTFRNDTAKDPAKRTLYVFLAEDGEYLAANHTGK